MTISNEILLQSIECSNLAHTISYIKEGLPLSYVNQAFLNQTGYRRDEVIGKNCRFLQGEGTDPESVRKIREAIKNFTPLEVEILNYKKDHTPFWNRLRLAPVFDQHNIPVAFIGIQSDITHDRERQRNEIERQKLEALGRMSANINHEIKNAIQPVMLLSETLLEWQNLNSDDVTRCTKIINENIKIAESIIKDTLRFSRRSSDSKENIVVSEIVSHVVSFAKNLLNSRVDFSVKTALKEPCGTATLNLERLLQVVLNLVNNSLFSMGYKGSLIFEFEIKKLKNNILKRDYLKEGKYFTISIIDDGGGIDEKILPSIFEPFFSTKPPGEGTGLGLAISYRLIREWGGSILVETEKGVGSKFEILIPYCDDSL
ncbi:two-component system sensor histidine kinase NtrB [Curvivirga aplysinae]|uniref:two-component system sensor histidine kinase NtrB n=1 Tax=Curvivirga aplysinae TaxID=2529852 RepID=UPI0012BBB79E|nr:PAS domain-containing protein [Curvivirga aplysinae]MTI08959.1 PAS domain-containing protein [Curvivirga aplysinae]